MSEDKKKTVEICIPESKIMANDSFNWNTPEDYFRLFDEGPPTNSNIKNLSTPSSPSPLPSSRPTSSSSGSGVTGSSSGSVLSGVLGLGSGDNLVDTDDATGLYYQLSSNASDSDRAGYEPGSNFMLLFEDFGEYFYNFNGSVTTVNSTSDEYDFHTNCSLGNSTCGNTTEGNYYTIFLKQFLHSCMTVIKTISLIYSSPLTCLQFYIYRCLFKHKNFPNAKPPISMV